MSSYRAVVLLTLLNPVEVAENAATLSAIADGNFVRESAAFARRRSRPYAVGERHMLV